MVSIERYRRLAREAMARARESFDTLKRSEWLLISDSWESLANEQSMRDSAHAQPQGSAEQPARPPV